MPSRQFSVDQSRRNRHPSAHDAEKNDKEGNMIDSKTSIIYILHCINLCEMFLSFMV